MFCPGCALEITDDLKFCRHCGANLRGVREAMISGTPEKFDWSKTWVADMFRSEEEKERRRFVTVEERRLHEERSRINEIKGGIITGMAGIGLMLFLYFFLSVVAASQKSPQDAEIIRHVWLVGIIPILVGIGIVLNGLFISPRFVKFTERLSEGNRPAFPPSVPPASLPDKSTAQMVSEPGAKSSYTVVEDATAQFPGDRA
jgi:hypothetical protein